MIVIEISNDSIFFIVCLIIFSLIIGWFIVECTTRYDVQKRIEKKSIQNKGDKKK